MQKIFNDPCEAYYEIFTDKPTKGYKYKFLSPFEFKNNLIKIATKSVGATNVLNAGMDNPNFYSTMPRYAFALLNRICIEIGEQMCPISDLGFIPPIKGIKIVFDKMLYKVRGLPEGKFLKKAYDKMYRISGMEKDVFTHNLVISTIGCFYPNPPRVQKFVEPVLVEFLDKIIYRSKKPLKNKVKIMATEGCAAAILYVFNTLKYNGLVIPGDKIGIITPIFSPYLEIPTLRNYNLTQICVNTDENNNWQIPQSEINKIGDSEMKALFIVNPTNPTGRSLSITDVRKIATTVRKKNPNLIILEDNVYAPFVREFNTFFNELPRNTIGVFSFSKYFGVTGWRLGTIVMHNSNIIDNRLLNNKFRKDTDTLKEINSRYKMLNVKPEKIKFIDRILADSRQVAESHVAGLSTPQQTIMSLFAVYDILDKERVYKQKLENMLLKRMKDLLAPIEYEITEDNLNTQYYLLIDISKAADRLMGGTDFGNYLREQRDPLEFLIKLAKGYGTVLLPAVGFAGSFWGVRVSLANLDINYYRPIGNNIRSLIDEYYDDFKKYEKISNKDVSFKIK